MKKGIVFIAPLGTRNKKAALFDEIISQCPDSDYSSVLYITPAVINQTEAKRQFFSYLKTIHKKHVYIPFQSVTIKNLSAGLYKTYGRENVLSKKLEPLALCEILDEKNIGYALLLSELLSKTRNYIPDKGLSQIKEDIRLQIFEEKTMERAVKAIEVLELYEKNLLEKGLVDAEHAVKLSVSLIKEYVSPDILVFDGFFDPTPLELNVVKTLIEKANKSYVLVDENAEFLRFFNSNGVRTEKKRLRPACSRKNPGYYAYKSKEDEVEGIAREVKRHILEGVKPVDILISFPLLSKYLPMIKRVFKKHGIPVNIADFSLLNIKPFVALEDLIASIEDNYPRNQFLSFLTSSHFSGIPQIIRQWAVSFSNRAGIVKGSQSWLSIKERLMNSADKEISADKKKILDKFQQEMKKIIHTLEKLKEKKSLVSFVDELESVLDRFGFLKEKLQGNQDGIGEPLSVPRNNEISRSIDSLFLDLRYFAEIYDLKEAGIEKAGFYLKHLLRGLRGRDENMHGVNIAPFELTAGLESEKLFFGGMIEGDFPSRPDIDPLLPEKVKKAMGLPFLEYYLDRQKRYFKRLIHVSSDDPYLSYPAADGETIFLPSPFLDWKTELTPPLSVIATEEENLVRAGALKRKNFLEVLWVGIDPCRDRDLLRDKNVQKTLMRRFGPETFINVTEIDLYRKCPLRFYIERFLSLEMEKPPRFEVEARLWGKLAHTTMEYLFEDKHIEPGVLEKKLFEGLEKSLGELQIGDFWSKVAREIFRKLLPMIQKQETDIRRQGFSPYLTEKTLKVMINSLRLKGKIDRIDRKTQSPVSGNTGQSTVIILDYKTGSVDRDSIQLPLYAALWQREHADAAEKTGFYSLKDGSVDWYPKKSGMEEFIQDALQRAGEFVLGMRAGLFRAIPFKEAECRYCYHGNLCKTNSSGSSG